MATATDDETTTLPDLSHEPTCDCNCDHPARWSILWAEIVRACPDLPQLACDAHTNELRDCLTRDVWFICRRGHFPRTQVRDCVLSIDPIR